ncbi:MAG: LLM class flavin-dependent oxidoreductase [Actinomycetota bacterium]|nr:LLM class flavin-dependent oxidoreductase [Actinomycetota bacterium]
MPLAEGVDCPRAASWDPFIAHLHCRDDERSERGPWEAWTLLGGLAASTQRVGLGPLVTCAGFRAPGLVAKMAATADEVSGGQMILGVGSGWNNEELSAFGLPFDQRASRFEESFEIIRRLLAGEHVTLHGRLYQADGAVLYPRPARSPSTQSHGPGALSLPVARSPPLGG